MIATAIRIEVVEKPQSEQQRSDGFANASDLGQVVTATQSVIRQQRLDKTSASIFQDCAILSQLRVAVKSCSRLVAKVQSWKFLSAAFVRVVGQQTLSWILVAGYMVLIAVLTRADHVPAFRAISVHSLIKINEIARSLIQG
jgi:hypothetical protein